MLTEDQKNEIVKLYKKGLPLRKITETIGYSQVTINKVVTEKGIKKRGERYHSINRAKLIGLPDDYLALKMPVKDLMKKYKIKSEQTFYKILDEFKLPRHRART